ncbi:hypothetical protein Moror_3654 [Moniliophthora roreri MCA 2997]|uniref:Uncharacterized protein n=2 Tax=Moniliophthora roreri TaxID=221103 RepID=V2XT42_MONRO|nr:hypothetical protein Moror_3654 [Moniliophthora roreri MCA 2997]KAI3603983.1 hypothetical protein WG66_000836 [Moniliophthora roreri]
MSGPGANYNKDNTTNAEFKKVYQEVNRPAVTDHNINDEYMRNPPHNLDTLDDNTHTAKPTNQYTEVPKKEDESMGRGILGDEGRGRAKHDVVEGEMVNENTVHRNT